MRRAAALAPGVLGQDGIASETPIRRADAFAALAPCFRGELSVLRKASLLARHALAAFARDGALFFRVHGGEAPQRLFVWFDHRAPHAGPKAQSHPPMRIRLNA